MAALFFLNDSKYTRHRKYFVAKGHFKHGVNITAQQKAQKALHDQLLQREVNNTNVRIPVLLVHREGMRTDSNKEISRRHAHHPDQNCPRARAAAAIVTAWGRSER